MPRLLLLLALLLDCAATLNRTAAQKKALEASRAIRSTNLQALISRRIADLESMTLDGVSSLFNAEISTYSTPEENSARSSEAHLMAELASLIYYPFDEPPFRDGPSSTPLNGSLSLDQNSSCHAVEFTLCHEDLYFVHPQTGKRIRGAQFCVARTVAFNAIIFRGTADADDVVVDGSFTFLGDLPTLSNDSQATPARMQGGFHASYFATGAAEIVRAAAAEMDPSLPLFLAGHSLGGALSTAAAFDLALRIHNGTLQAFERLELYTFGKPVVGDPTFGETFGEMLRRGLITSSSRYVTATAKMLDPVAAIQVDIAAIQLEYGAAASSNASVLMTHEPASAALRLPCAGYDVEYDVEARAHRDHTPHHTPIKLNPRLA